MIRITYFIRTKKTHGDVPVRLRLTDGRNADIFHKTDIKASLEDLSKLTPECQLRPRVAVFNRNLFDRLQTEIELMKQAYAEMLENGMDLNGKVLGGIIEGLKNPIVALRNGETPIVEKFRQYVENIHHDGIIGDRRKSHILVVADKLERFLTIKGISHLTAQELNEEILMEFRNFLFDEYLYVSRFPRLYDEMLPQNTPKKRLSVNTVVSQLKMLQAFFSELENLEEISRSPFRRLGKERRKVVMKTKYNEPYFLRHDEFMSILSAEVPKHLVETRDAFLVQCAFGCRIGDFQRLRMENISVSEEGIPYVHYLPQKTADEQFDNVEVKTPIARFAFDIIIRTRFNFPLVRNVYGRSGYNIRIKSLLKICGLDRRIPIFDETTKDNVYVPLYEVGSSKLARKTHVDMLNKIQIDMYAAGLHKKGSSAVNRYTNMELKDRFRIINLAFEQEEYTVDAELNII